LSTNGRVLGVDPGFTTGISLVDITTGHEHSWWHIKFPDMLQWLRDNSPESLGIDEIFMEDFALLAGKALAQSGSKFETVQVIGMFALWAQDIPIHMQPPTIKSMAEKWTGVKPKGTHDKSHHVDAFNHACYGLRKQGRYRTVLEREHDDRPD